MVQTYLARGSPYLELYVQFSSPNDAFATSTSNADREEYTTPSRHFISGWQNTEAPVFSSSMKYTTPARHSVGGWDMHLGSSKFDIGNIYWGMTSTSSGWQSTSDWGHYETSRRRDDVLLMTSTSEGTSFVADDGGSNDESDVDSPREPGPDGTKVRLLSEPEPVPTIPEDVEGGLDEEEKDLRFRVYSPSAHIHNVDLSQNDALDFLNLPHRRRDHTSSSLDSGEIEVGREFSNKDSFLATLKQHSIMNGVNYNVVKSKSDKFEAKCAVEDGVLQDHPKMDSDMLASLILATLKVDLKTLVLVLIANIRSQLKYMPSYCKTLKRHLRITTTYFSVDAKCSSVCSGALSNVGTHLYTDGSGRIIPIAFAITLGESSDNWDFFLSRLRRHVCPKPDICVISKSQLSDKEANGITHTIACQHLRLDPITYVDQVYKIEYMYNVWRHVFPSIPDERKWLSVSLAPFKLLPDRELRCKPKGRPYSTRICNNIDIREVTTKRGELVVGVGRMTHLDRIMNAELFASPMVKSVEVLGQVAVWALLIGPRRHLFFLDLKGPSFPLHTNLPSPLFFQLAAQEMPLRVSTTKIARLLRSGTIKGFSILEDQINLARDFKDKLSKFRSSLTLTRAFLQDAEKRQLDELVKFWLEQLRDIAYEANDVLDELAYEHVRWKVDNQMSKKVSNFFSLSKNPMAFTLKMSKKSRMRHLLLWRLVTSFGKEADVLKIVDLLIGSTTHQSLSITSIVGMAVVRETLLDHRHHLKVVVGEECWSIIKERAFGNSSIFSESEVIGRDIAKQCGGVPPVATVIGETLCNKRDRDEWSPSRIVLFGVLWK
ncbi:hypothetical protein GOBAR_AA00245 [Gossypium barbadense]|uniref:Disease resistance N-terminal domain-containing protein n=1 Tax=Gossypium barbadense TaxID=3634 RepID=A0A2P5YXM5_GOSBA|nr:hypothetical protein GOBAR_AA00245 [Gossypium barbadense]